MMGKVNQFRKTLFGVCVCVCLLYEHEHHFDLVSEIDIRDCEYAHSRLFNYIAKSMNHVNWRFSFILLYAFSSPLLCVRFLTYT